MRDLGRPADVLRAVGGAEAEVAVEAVAEVVAVEPVGGDAVGDEALLQRRGHRRLPRARQAGHPDRRAALAEQRPTLLAIDRARLPDDVRATAPAEGVV